MTTRCAGNRKNNAHLGGYAVTTRSGVAVTPRCALFFLLPAHREVNYPAYTTVATLSEIYLGNYLDALMAKTKVFCRTTSFRHKILLFITFWRTAVTSSKLEVAMDKTQSLIPSHFVLKSRASRQFYRIWLSSQSAQCSKRST